MMHFGIVATTDAYADRVAGLLAAALTRGWNCRCFLTDRGVLLLWDERLGSLARDGRLRLDFCEHSWVRFGGGAPAPIGFSGSQYQNAELALRCDRVLVL